MKIASNKTLLKAKVNNNMDVSLAFKRPMPYCEDLIEVTAGLGTKNFTSEDRNFKHGVQLDINL